MLQRAYRTADRINIPLLCNSCNLPDTLMHRYFYCSYVKPVWNTLNILFPSSNISSNNDINWFFCSQVKPPDEDYRVIMFITALWSIHTAFLENFSTPSVLKTLPLNRLSFYISQVFKNILFGTNWPLKLATCIKFWPNPWFLEIFYESQEIKIQSAPTPKTSFNKLSGAH